MQYREGSIKESVTEPGDFGCCYYYHLGVLTQALGYLLSHRPSTLAVLVPLK